MAGLEHRKYGGMTHHAMWMQLLRCGISKPQLLAGPSALQAVPTSKWQIRASLRLSLGGESVTLSRLCVRLTSLQAQRPYGRVINVCDSLWHADGMVPREAEAMRS